MPVIDKSVALSADVACVDSPRRNQHFGASQTHEVDPSTAVFATNVRFIHGHVIRTTMGIKHIQIK